MRSQFIPVSFLALLALSSCSTKSSTNFPPVKGSESRVLTETWEKQASSGLKEVNSPTDITIPLVTFRNPGSGYSTPDWEVSAAGSYSMYQVQQSGHSRTALSILATPGQGPELKEAPSVFSMPSPGTSGEEPREWKTIYVPALKKNIRYHLVDFAAGDTHDQWATEVFTIGNVSYRANIELTDSAQAPALFARLAVKK